MFPREIWWYKTPFSSFQWRSQEYKARALQEYLISMCQVSEWRASSIPPNTVDIKRTRYVSSTNPMLRNDSQFVPAEDRGSRKRERCVKLPSASWWWKKGRRSVVLSAVKWWRPHSSEDLEIRLSAGCKLPYLLQGGSNFVWVVYFHSTLWKEETLIYINLMLIKEFIC